MEKICNKQLFLVGCVCSTASAGLTPASRAQQQGGEGESPGRWILHGGGTTAGPAETSKGEKAPGNWSEMKHYCQPDISPRYLNKFLVLPISGGIKRKFWQFFCFYNVCITLMWTWARFCRSGFPKEILLVMFGNALNWHKFISTNFSQIYQSVLLCDVRLALCFRFPVSKSWFCNVFTLNISMLSSITTTFVSYWNQNRCVNVLFIDGSVIVRIILNGYDEDDDDDRELRLDFMLWS